MVCQVSSLGQRDFYDGIIRDEKDLALIRRKYREDNPYKLQEDRYQLGLRTITWMCGHQNE